MEMEERLKRMKTLVLKEVARAAKNGNTASIVKNAEVLKKAEQLIKALDQIKTQMKALEEQIHITSSTDLRVAEEEKTAKFPSKTEDVPTETESKTTDDGTTREQLDFERRKVSEKALRKLFSDNLIEEDLLETGVQKG
jgi:seryl-tRNA synthetase